MFRAIVPNCNEIGTIYNCVMPLILCIFWVNKLEWSKKDQNDQLWNPTFLMYLKSATIHLVWPLVQLLQHISCQKDALIAETDVDMKVERCNITWKNSLLQQTKQRLIYCWSLFLLSYELYHLSSLLKLLHHAKIKTEQCSLWPLFIDKSIKRC